jgi:membrane dipeptidase
MRSVVKLFDLHADIGYDVYHQSLKQAPNPLRHEHAPKLKRGGIEAVAMASFFQGDESLEVALAMVEMLDRALTQNTDVFHRVLDGDFSDTKINALMSLEGLGFLQEEHYATLDTFHRLGIRMASLTWNDQNACATGISGSVLRGLTPFGQAVVKRFNELKIVVDVSHLNEASFWDVLRSSKRPILASHSNTKRHCFVERNLSDQQIRALIEQGGLIGLNAARNFVHLESARQDAYHLAAHATHMIDLGGAHNVALGFDFMDFFDFGEASSKMAHDLLDATQAQSILDALAKQGLGIKQIEQIAFFNAQHFFQDQLA